MAAIRSNGRSVIKERIEKPHREVPLGVLIRQYFRVVQMESCSRRRRPARLPRRSQWKRSEKQRLQRRRGRACGRIAI